MTDQPDYAGVPVPPESFLSEIRQGGNRTLTDDFIACAEWGANEQLSRCMMYLYGLCMHSVADAMGLALRPKTVSLKRQALEAFRVMHDHPVYMLTDSAKHIDIIRRALEALPDD
jgi:hypothetical protein